MGRNKRNALNQVIANPVATPEQIEEMQIEGAKMIAEEVDKKIQEDLHNMPAKLLAPELESVVPLADSPQNPELESIKILQEGAGLVYGEDYVDDPTIERKLVEKKGPSDEWLNKSSEKGSVADQRMKLKTGMSPKILGKGSVADQRMKLRGGMKPR